MKNCPRCGTQYTDDTLLFCLQDGTPLGAVIVSDPPTMVLNETETVARRGDRIRVPLGSEETNYEQNGQTTRVMPSKSGPSVLAIVTFVIGGLFFIAFALGLGAIWLYSRNDPSDIANNSGNRSSANVLTPANMSNFPVPTTTPYVSKPPPGPSVLPTSTSGRVTPPSPPPTADNDQARGEAVRRLYAWKSMLESHDINGYMGNYADSVDYYRKRGVSVNAIRADKARAFRIYDSMRVNISNETAAMGPDGNSASVTFDKEWHFTGRSRSEGKTRSQLDLIRINGIWLITGERDLKLYSINKIK